MICDREPAGVPGTGWPFPMWDWNVEENYCGVVRANRTSLLRSLAHDLTCGSATMRQNARGLLNATATSKAMVLA